MDRIQIKAHVKFEIKVPSIDEIKESDIPEPYEREEWYEQLISDAVREIIDHDILECYIIEGTEKI